MERSIERNWVGIDVSKNHWDVAVFGKKRVRRFTSGPAGCRQLMAMLVEKELTHVCLEATGGYEQRLVTALHEQDMHVSVVNPRQVRDFARAQGQLAKTDAIDAQMIAAFAVMMQPAPHEKPSENQVKLRSLRARRQQVSGSLVQENNRLETQPDRDARRSIEEAVDFYQQQLESLNTQIKQLVQGDAEFQHRLSLLVSVPAIGDITAAALMADLPELGTLNRRQAGRLAGLAPINRDSGMFRGKRMIGGGRASVRQALFMPTLVATRHNPVIRDFYQQLLSRGKCKMTALTACMRKLLLILNAILKENKPWKSTLTT